MVVSIGYLITVAEGKEVDSPEERDQNRGEGTPVKPIGFTGAFSFDDGVKQNIGENWCQKHLADQQLPGLLEKIDKDLAEEIRVQGCAHCRAGRLHSARIRRKPRGLPKGTTWDSRFSFCCDQEGCRKRTTPPSVRFMGRRVYAGFIVLLLPALSHGLSPDRVRRLREITGADRRTLQRWRDF